MKKLFTLFLFLLPFCALSQSNYYKATVITNNGEKLTGFIDYREWDKAPKYIKFKNNVDDKNIQTFYPSGILSFSIDGYENYITYKGNVSMNRIHTPDIPTGIDTSSADISIFLRQLRAGDNVSLYSYSDSIKTRYFVQEKLQLPIELKYQLYYDTEDRSKTIAVNTYLRQLSYVASKYRENDSELLARIQRYSYSADIANIIDRINGSTGSKNGGNKVSGTRTYVGIGLNVNRSSLNYNQVVNSAPSSGSAGQVVLNTRVQSDNYLPGVSLGIDLFSNRAVQKTIFRAELSANYDHPNFTTYPTFLTTQAIFKTFSFSQFRFGFTPQFIWNFYSKDKFKAFVDGGLSVNYSVFANKKTEGTTSNNDLSIYKLQPLQVGFLIQGGIVLNKQIEVFAAYQQLDLLSIKDPYYYEENRVLTVGIHWFFHH